MELETALHRAPSDNALPFYIQPSLPNNGSASNILVSPLPRFTLPFDYLTNGADGCGGGGGGSSSSGSSCMEQLLIHCATALETHDSTSAQQILWVLNNIASPDGDSTQRLTSAFLRALITRAAQSGGAAPPCFLQHFPCRTESPTRRLSVIELAGFLDLTPWNRFGFSAANAAIAEAVESFSVVRIIDLSLSHCMQWPTLIDSLSNRPERAPFIRLQVFSGTISGNLPEIDMTYEELGIRLTNFARSRNVGLEFTLISVDGIPSLMKELQNQRLEIMNLRLDTMLEEALVVNCQMLLHYIPDETLDANSSSGFHLSSPVSACASSSLRFELLKEIRSMEPTIVTLVDEDADLTSTNLVARLKSAFNYLWIPFDAVETFLPRENKQRILYESDICHKIENIIAFEGERRIERLESKARWVQRMERASFRNIGFSEDTVAEMKSLLEEHAAGWGLKKEDDDLVLTWKGHNVVFATAWVPT
ncbi:Scarecrow-like protein 32 [Nymphaea thermarum]|nr:Scarecrow-like protein 32 [Nymphaea thermarum]